MVSDSLSRVLDEATYGADATVTGGGLLSYVDSTLTWTGDLQPGATATVSYSIRVQDPYRGDRALANSVVSTAAGSSCSTGAEPACTVQVQVLVPGLDVTTTADRTTVVAGDRVTYTVVLTNTGETDHQPATFRDSFADPGVSKFADYADDAVATSGTVSYTNQTLVWTGPLAVGQTATVTFSVVTRAPAPADGSRVLRNAVTSATPGSTCVTDTPAHCSTAVTVLVPELTLNKTADTSRIVAGGSVVYTITGTNTGQADYPQASFTDSLHQVLDEGVYNADATASSGAVSYDQGVLSWVGPLTRGSTVVLTFSLTLNPDVTGDASLQNRVVSTSVGSTCPPDSTNPACVASTEVEASYLGLAGLTPDWRARQPRHPGPCGDHDGVHQQLRRLLGDGPGHDCPPGRPESGKHRHDPDRAVARPTERQHRVHSAECDSTLRRPATGRGVRRRGGRSEQRLPGGHPVRRSGHLHHHRRVHRDGPMTQPTPATVRAPQRRDMSDPTSRTPVVAALALAVGMAGTGLLPRAAAAAPPAPQLSIAVDNQQDATTAGASVAYTVTVTNLGRRAVKGPGDLPNRAGRGCADRGRRQGHGGVGLGAMAAGPAGRRGENVPHEHDREQGAGW